MKTLKRIWPFFFLILSVGMAVFTAGKVREMEEALPGGVLVFLEDKEIEGQSYLLMEKEDGPLYKNQTVQKVKKEYGTEVSPEDLTELEPIKSLLSESWKIYLLVFYFLVMMGIWRCAVRCITRGYAECKKEKISKTAVRVGIGVSLYLASIGLWYLLICHIEIPQQYLPIAGIWDLGYMVEEIQGFYQKALNLGSQIPELRDVWKAGSVALKGYGVSILALLPGWAGMVLRKNFWF